MRLTLIALLILCSTIAHAGEFADAPLTDLRTKKHGSNQEAKPWHDIFTRPLLPVSQFTVVKERARLAGSGESNRENGRDAFGNGVSRRTDKVSFPQYLADANCTITGYFNEDRAAKLDKGEVYVLFNISEDSRTRYSEAQQRVMTIPTVVLSLTSLNSNPRFLTVECHLFPDSTIRQLLRALDGTFSIRR
ncbi:MAG: hypothetical protein V4760_12965 [Bdellovibrionota bacterium]